MIESINYDKTKGESSMEPCASCQSTTYHVVLSSVDIQIGLINAKAFEHYQVIQCQGCRRTISFRKIFKIPKKVLDTAKPAPRGMSETRELYPPRHRGRFTMESTYLLPAPVDRIYRETQAALSSGQPVLAGIGIRALVETVCKNKGALGHNLEKKIDALAVMGLMTAEQAEFLHGLRILGNEAAHEVKPHGDQTLGAAMDVVEHLLKTVYVLPVKAKPLPRR